MLQENAIIKETSVSHAIEAILHVRRSYTTTIKLLCLSSLFKTPFQSMSNDNRDAWLSKHCNFPVNLLEYTHKHIAGAAQDDLFVREEKCQALVMKSIKLYQTRWTEQVRSNNLNHTHLAQ